MKMTTKLKRYDLETVGSDWQSYEAMEERGYGDWIEVENLVTVLEEILALGEQGADVASQVYDLVADIKKNTI